MQYFAQTDLNELSILLVAIFGAFGGILLGFYKYANSREKEFEKARVAQTEAFELTLAKLSKSIDASTAAHIDVANATNRAANEAAERNGHLAELTVEARKDIIDAIKSLDKQDVVEQNVENQHVHQVVKEKK